MDKKDWRATPFESSSSSESRFEKCSERFDDTPKRRLEPSSRNGSNEIASGSIYRFAPSSADGKNPNRYRNVRCPVCQTSVAVAENDLGTTVVCSDCETKIGVPSDLPFFETEYERRFYNEERLRQDRLLSPIRNPNRVGVDVDKESVYQLDAPTNGLAAKNGKTNKTDKESKKGKNENFAAFDGGENGEGTAIRLDAAARRSRQYRSVPCPLCNTEFAATRADLERTILCPDCGTKFKVPKNLDFSQTESERARFDLEKRRRDELLSPMRNPNRDGVDVDSPGAYSLDADSSFVENALKRKRPTSAIYLTDAELAVRSAARELEETERNAATTAFGDSKIESTKNAAAVSEKKNADGGFVGIPIRCRVCETLFYAPSETLGKTARCPDCGTETTVSQSFQELQNAAAARFAPTERGTYSLAAPQIFNSSENEFATKSDNSSETSSVSPLRAAFEAAQKRKYGRSGSDKSNFDAEKSDNKNRKSWKNRKKEMENEELDEIVYRAFLCSRCKSSIFVLKKEVGTTLVCPDCGSRLVVPDYLDFSPTSEERRRAARRVAEKKKRDALLSPLKNPNRDGVDVQSDSVYALVENGAENKYEGQEFFPVYCSVCKTLINASRERLGKPIRCPDCGAETLATTKVREQIRAEEAEYIVPAPESAEGDDGEIGAEKKDAETFRVEALSKRPTTKEFRFREKRSQVWRPGVRPEEENIPLVARRRGDGIVWVLASPPKRASLFNRAFRALATPELWWRGIVLGLAAFGVALTVATIFLPKTTSMESQNVYFQAAMALGFSATGILTIYIGTLWAEFFTAIFAAGNLGVRRIRDWELNDGFWSQTFFGIRILGIALLAATPGFLVATATNEFGREEIVGVLNSATDSEIVSWFGAFEPAASLWLVFPVFFLATFQTDWYFAPICRAVVRSWRRRAGVWAQFYFASSFVVAVPLAFFFRFVGFTNAWLAAGIALPVATALYALLLGRLSWILDDDIRRDEEAENEKKNAAG